MPGKIKVVLVCALLLSAVGCDSIAGNRVVRRDTGRLQSLRAGVLTLADGKEDAFVVLQTTIGVYEMAISGFPNSPSQALGEWKDAIDLMSKQKFPTPVRLNLWLLWYTDENWKRAAPGAYSGPEQTYTLGYIDPLQPPSPSLHSLTQGVMSLSTKLSDGAFDERFECTLDIPFVYTEVEKIARTTHIGP
jgi:hypothetical protein